MNAIVIMEGIATLGFFSAFVFAYKMQRNTFYITSIWTHICIAMLLYAIGSLSNVLEWMNLIPKEAEMIEEITKCLGAYALFTMTISYYREYRLHRSMSGSNSPS